jgi:membrane associated rhomboid family serine protease
MYFGAWWTPFTAIYLHWTWSLVLSLLLIRQFGTGLEVVFGRARYFIIFVSSGAFGYFSSSVVGLVGVRGAAITAGSGPALGGLIAAAFVYGKYQHTEEGALIAARALMYAGLSLFWSLVMPGIDITANASGLCAGYIVARLLVGQAGMPEGPGLKGTAIALATVCVGGLIASLVTLGGSR